MADTRLIWDEWVKATNAKGAQRQAILCDNIEFAEHFNSLRDSAYLWGSDILQIGVSLVPSLVLEAMVIYILQLSSFLSHAIS